MDFYQQHEAQREKDKGVYRVFFEKWTIITASDGQ